MYPRGPYSLLVQGTSIPYPAEHEGGDEDEDEEDDLDIDLPPPTPKIQTYKQAIESLEDIMIFLEQHGQIELASKATSHWQPDMQLPYAKQHLTISLIDSFDSLQQYNYIFRNVYYH